MNFTKWPRLTIFGRSFLLVACELLVNALLWVVAVLLFGRRHETHGVLNLCLLAWTIGLRHGLDADHISAIDNATRGLLQLGQLSVTAGLYFSLGHSTIVVVVIVAIAISTDVYDRIGGISDVGGIIGAAVSASFLFVVALVNSIILARILRQRKRRLNGEDVGPENSHSLALRILGPVTKFVNRSWKMYPVGVLFGLGFDTASSIALLAVTALAQRGADGAEMPHSHIVILPLLFTAGMTLVDSADSVLMLYSYADFPEKGFALFERQETPISEHSSFSSQPPTEVQPGPSTSAGITPEPLSPKLSITSHHTLPDLERNNSTDSRLQEGLGEDEYKITLTEQKTLEQAAKNTMSGLSIILTLLSILVAFSISLITIMGLIGENCDSCREAAEDPNGGGLAGSWWRGWARANDMSGFIGAAVVGCFVVIVAGWYGGRWFLQRRVNRPAIQL
ncbi:High-affinity nickel transport protein OS=Cupriavidus necator (strain ATCC 17699 / H16 / DSM 428 / Stanier 337) GN=hoxN PE=1 SV=3 [Rhizoctonia solani AG-1 IB]|uniref:Nickel/cobalt efflux system n=1 Tax=Thanatephorus cucumeris (strain AG1-IB / isolate 7/3/14) TaxID=1108050 RepID=A0A0B7G2C4_THACB|nr:High-affinity nickel transport protein OS=Cupriavidus necator (strain ATCC 17699 / H16 / DSM 428 / Stanier 337) GN=hoxN PE=1 SV=3 [Rhizoctonia solani AG-1 IB]